mgnify:FL=1
MHNINMKNYQYAQGGTYMDDVSAIQKEWDMIVSGMEPQNAAFAYGDPFSKYKDPYSEDVTPLSVGGGGGGSGLLGGGVGADVYGELRPDKEDVVQYGGVRPPISDFAINTPDEFGGINQLESEDLNRGGSGGYIARPDERTTGYMEDVQMAKYGMRKRMYPYGGKY